MPSQSRFGPCSPRYDHFSVSHCTTLSGPKRALIGPTDTIWGQKLVKTRQKGSPHIARVDFDHERSSSRSFRAPCWVIFGPVRARGGPSRAGSGRSGAKGHPEDGCLKSPNPSGGLQNPNGDFHFSRHFGASCRLLLACDAQAHSVALICFLLLFVVLII